jgi:hypothetical protein
VAPDRSEDGHRVDPSRPGVTCPHPTNARKGLPHGQLCGLCGVQVLAE